FFDMLKAEGLDVIAHPLDDHHRFSANGSELRFDDDLPVLTTEKDAVKCADLTLPKVWVVPAEAQLPQSFADAVHRRLCAMRGKPEACT
ncbi:MAG: tetraacyldisaccharide 4'-kinase, partial [Lysobacterales bacterium]